MTPEDASPLSLRAAAAARDFGIGAAVSPVWLRDDPTYGEVLAREFNLLVAENAMKMKSLQDKRGKFDFVAADRIVNFARQHAMRVRGHTLVWHNCLPAWLTEGDFSGSELNGILQEHIETVASHYAGRLAAWDVVNEAIADDGSMRKTLWLEGIGPKYVAKAFRWAHEADPEARLFYNDYGGEGLNAKADTIYAMVRGLLDQGAPLHGVGLQMHISLEKPPRPRDVAANLKRLGALGLATEITEMDVRLRKPVTEEQLEAQARVYRELMDVCLEAEACDALLMWGFTDKYSWVPKFFEGYDAGLIFDADYAPKPACRALLEALRA